MIDRLPAEVLLHIIDREPIPQLRYVSRHFYILYNDMSKDLFLHLLPLAKAKQLEPFLFEYLKSLEFWNGPLQKLVEPDPIWWIALSFLYGRKVFFQPKFADIDMIDDTSDLSFNEFDTMKIHKAKKFTYKQDIYLPARSSFSFKLAVNVHKSTKGLGTMTCKIAGPRVNYKPHLHLPSNITEILAPEELNILFLSHFNTARRSSCISLDPPKVLTKCTIVIEETGLHPKKDLEFEYIDFKYESNSFLYSLPSDGEIVSDLERTVHVALELLLQDKNPQLARSLIPRYPHEASYTQYDWEKFYTEGTLRKKMNRPVDDSDQLINKGCIRHWKVPFRPDSLLYTF